MSRVLFVAVLLLVAIATPAQASSDRVDVAEDGTVVFVRVVPIERNALLRVLLDPSLSSKLSPDVLSKEVLEAGDCPVYRVATKGLFQPLVYDFRGCTTADGLTEELVASEDFDAFACRWQLTSVEGGTEIRYELLIKPRLKVPVKLVRVGQRRSMKAALNRLVEHAR